SPSTAQNNPLTNSATKRYHTAHPFPPLSKRSSSSRPIFLPRTAFDAWPADLQRAMRTAVTEAVAFQRGLHVQEEEDARKAIEAQGCEIVELGAAEHDAFAAAVEPLLNQARATFGRALFDLTA